MIGQSIVYCTALRCSHLRGRQGEEERGEEEEEEEGVVYYSIAALNLNNCTVNPPTSLEGDRGEVGGGGEGEEEGAVYYSITALT